MICLSDALSVNIIHGAMLEFTDDRIKTAKTMCNNTVASIKGFWSKLAWVLTDLSDFDLASDESADNPFGELSAFPYDLSGFENPALLPQQQQQVLGGVYGAQIQGAQVQGIQGNGRYSQMQGYPVYGFGYGAQSQSGRLNKLMQID